MITYLLSATLLWAFSLLLYDVLFRRLRMHAENRAYLLLSLLAGLLMPLLSIRVAAPAAAVLRSPVVQSAALRTQLAARVSGPEHAAGSAGWWVAIWAAGACLMLAMLLRQAAALWALFRGAALAKSHGCTVVSSPRAQAPCSFFGYIFIPAAHAYSPQELDMILRHEQQHGRLLHSLDIVVLQLLRVVLWFHPLVHLFYARLRLVHEYQADAVEQTNAAGYGRFLLEQTLLGSASSFAHSIFHSPLKTRIAMLLKTSTATRLRYLAALLLLPVFFLCCAYAAPKGERVNKGNLVFWNGNIIALQSGGSDTDIVVDPVTNQERIIISTQDSFPVTLNGQKIYKDNDWAVPAKFKGIEFNGSYFIFNKLELLLRELPDGEYWLIVYDAVIGTDGRLAYFKIGEGLHHADYRVSSMQSKIDPALKARIDAAFDKILEDELFYEPATMNGKPVPSMATDLQWMGSSGKIVVLNHSVKFLRPVHD